MKRKMPDDGPDLTKRFQEDVATLDEYANHFSGATQRENARDDIHEFFSPARVTRGMSRDQVKLIASLLPLRRIHRKQYSELPDKLVPKRHGKITTMNFGSGIGEFLREAAVAVESTW